jgi:hypothetical protein
LFRNSIKKNHPQTYKQGTIYEAWQGNTLYVKHDDPNEEKNCLTKNPIKRLNLKTFQLWSYGEFQMLISRLFLSIDT